MRWLGPRGLMVTGVQVALSAAFAQYADKRELQAALKVPAIIDRSGDDGLWFDWLADTGDGFDATYATATLLAREHLDLSAPSGEVESTPRGSLLVLGGDLTYPAAAPAEYLDRFVGPYQSAFPALPPGQAAPPMLCIAGNHDWYDGLTTFLRLFCNGQAIGGWQTEQTRSYFVVKLPARWWIMGIDLALDYFIDTPQLDFFRDLAREQMRPGDRLILMMHQPSWLFGGPKSETDLYSPMAESNLQRFEREVIHPAGLDLCLAIGGDIHHYCRYERTDGSQTRIVCGSGGTFIYPTHHIPDEILWPEADGVARYELRSRYPSKETSQRLRWRTLLAPLLNRSFVVFVGLLYLLFAFAVRFSLVADRDLGFAEIAETVPLSEIRQRLLYNPVSLIIAAGLWGGMVVFADCRRWRWRVVVGGLHGLVHLIVLTAVIWTAARLLVSLDGPLVLFVLFAFRLDIAVPRRVHRRGARRRGVVRRVHVRPVHPHEDRARWRTDAVPDRRSQGAAPLAVCAGRRAHDVAAGIPAP